MKFEPLLFIEIAKRDGVQLTRVGNNIHFVNASQAWIAAIKKHKRQLIKHLPHAQAPSLQVDLFEELDGNTRPPHQP